MTNRKIWSRISTYLDLSPEKLLSGNPINNYLYDTILDVSEAASFPNPQNPGFYIKRYALKGVTPPDILNEAYYQCAKIVGDPNPEVDFYNFIEADIRENVHDRKDYLPLVFSVMYVLLNHMKTTPARVRRVLHLLDKKLEYDLCYFPAFKELLSIFKKEGLKFVVNLNPRRFSIEKDSDYMVWDDEFGDIDVITKCAMSTDNLSEQLYYLAGQKEEIMKYEDDNKQKKVAAIDSLMHQLQYHYFSYDQLPLMEEDTDDTKPDEIISNLRSRINELSGTVKTCTSSTAKETIASEEPGLVSIHDLMNEAHTLDRASRLNLITSLERLLAQQSGDINKILESERNSLNVEIKDEDYSQDEDGRSVFVVLKTLDKIFKKLGIVQKTDNLKLARLYAYISGYKYTTIKNRLPVDDDIPERSKDEVKTVQKLLNDVNSDISMN